jgi:hypothetical protein
MGKQEQKFVVCISNDGCEDLELRKLYAVVSDERPGQDAYLRVIDESGQDYLYPAKYFASVTLSKDAALALGSA